MLEDFKRALARVQSDYGFYVDCQTNPAVALAGYDLSAEERRALIDPETLGDMLRRGIGLAARPSITVKISGSHDWINRAATATAVDDAEHRGRVATEVDAIGRAGTEPERTRAVVRLMELIG